MSLTHIGSALALIPLQHKLALKRHYFRLRVGIARWLFSYTALQLEGALRSLGIGPGDTLFMHSSFSALNGFQDGPRRVIDCVLNVIGASGNLLMVSMAYRGSTHAYLSAGQMFDVKKTVSRMGLISELFRRRAGVLRSLSPSHPILALGPQSRWLTADHDRARFPCGPETPFEKALLLNAKALFFNVPFRSLTFFHYVEHVFQEALPVALYDTQPIECVVRDMAGATSTVTVQVFSREAREARYSGTLERELRNKHWLTTAKIGNTTLSTVGLQQVIDCAREMAIAGQPLYQASRQAHRRSPTAKS